MKSTPVYQVRDLIPGTPYMVVRFIGAGGMGSVYEVEDTTIGKPYVLKTINLDFAKGREASGLEEMMRREARALARAAHPHIVEVITAGKTADRLGLPYLVMEKLEGVTVRTMLQSLSFPRQSVWQIANELLEALYHLHHPDDARPPMLHRDIKPENIFLARKHDKKYVTKLLDLGIAVILDGQAHGVHGTPSYMAPEQFRNEPLTEHTDLYQAGCVIFEMLTGRHPFYGAKSAPEWVEAHLWRDPPRVSQLVDVPRRVDDVLFAALSKLPSKRPRDAHALMAGLHALRDANDTATPIAVNTTVEDLHTAIEKRGESGYLAYATETGTIQGITFPPLEGKTLEDAYPSFAVASTEAPPRGRLPQRLPIPAHKGQTVRMGQPPAPGGVDREAPTRSPLKLFVKRTPRNDTEELDSSELYAGSARAAQSRRSPPNANVAPSRERTNATPFAAEVAPRAIRRVDSYHKTAFFAAAIISFGGLLSALVILRYGNNHRSTPAASAATVSASASSEATVSAVTEIPSVPAPSEAAMSVASPSDSAPTASSVPSPPPMAPTPPTKMVQPIPRANPRFEERPAGYMRQFDEPSSPSSTPSGSPDVLRTF